jgi:hypothetical protein
MPQLNISNGAMQAIAADPALRNVVSAFSKHFRTNFARIEPLAHLGEYAYLYLYPEPQIRERFGMNREVLCFTENLSQLDSRVFEAIEEILKRDSVKLVDDAIFFVSDSPQADALCKEYMERSHRKIIKCDWRNIESAHEDFVVELLRQFLYSRDFFDVRDPVSSDGQFFARYKLVDEIFAELSAGQSFGVFGLRKIGKTSVLERMRKRNSTGNHFRVALLDAQQPEIYKNDAAGVILEICRAFNRAWAAAHGSGPFEKDVPAKLSLIEASSYFRDFVQRLLAQGKPLLVIIDELERILPSRSRLTNWNTEFIDFWRVLRSQSQTTDGKFVFLIASTNPYFIETSKLESEDNPLYRFLKSRYLPMFTFAELNDMLHSLGTPMGISFTDGALEIIHAEFGGHPFLSRQLCSEVARDLENRPLVVEDRHVRKTLERYRLAERDDIEAILKVFADFYPEEHELLEALSKDERRAIRLLDERYDLARHLIGYGLIDRTKNSYRFTMEALPPYLKASRPKEFKQPDIPDKTRERHLTLQKHMNFIEPSLRNLIQAGLRTEFGANWQVELLKHISLPTKSKIDSREPLSANEVMEELLFSDVISAVNGHWKLFSKVFVSKEEFKQHSYRLNSYARGVADHRKYELCKDDSKFIPAVEACEWFCGKLD